MAFLNATLLFGFLAAAIPIALHLLGRREPKRVVFPAVRFLTQRLETNRRRLQVRRWVLLAMRVALLAMLAVALARPEVHRAATGTWLGIAALAVIALVVLGLALWALATGQSASLRWALAAAGVVLLLAAGGWGAAAIAGGPRPVDTPAASAAVAILIDNGPTSAYETPSGERRIDTAREMATWLIGRYRSDSRLAVLDRSARPAAFAMDAAAVQRRISQTEPLQTTRPLIERIEAAVRLLRTSELPRRALFILTDLTESGWGATDDSAATLAALIAEEPRVTVQVVDTGSAAYFNRFLGEVELADPTPPRGVPSTLSVEVHQEREQTSAPGSDRQLTVQLRLHGDEAGLPVERDGEAVYPPLRTTDRQSIRIADGQATRVVLSLPPLEVGTHHAVVELVDADPLAIDNRRYATVRVAEPRRVLLVADDPEQREIMALILNPYGVEDPRREYDIDLASTTSLRDRSFKQYAAVGLFDPTLPPVLVRRQMESWVREGGSLFVALGPAIDAEATSGEVDWPLVGNPQRVWRVPEPGTFLQILRSGHPAVETFSSFPGGAPWNAFRVHLYWQLRDRQQWSAIMQYAGTDHLALAERNVGGGRVVALTTPLPARVPPSREWNDLLAAGDAWPVFILVQQIFEDLSGGRASEMNVTVGQPVALSVSPEAASRYQLFTPDSPAVPVDAGEGVVVPGVPLVAGNYWLRGSGGQRYGYSADLPPSATRLARVDEDRLDTVLGAENYQVVRDRDDVQWAEGEASDSRPLYAGAMLVVAGLFLLEQILSNRFYPQGREPRPSVAAAGGKRATVAAA